jgi:YD repeat-containing protein
MKRLAASIMVCLAAGSALAADNPNTAKGFQPGHLYQFGEISHVNLFNGNLNLSFPIGQTYPVGGNLSYGFTLAYAGNNWVAVSRQGQECEVIDGNQENCVDKWYYHNVPTVPSNAGMGWFLSSGGQLTLAYLANQPSQSPMDPVYVAANGALNNFGTAGERVNLSDGATYMRLKAVYCDDGAPCKDVELPDGTIHRFRNVGGIPLLGMRDRFGNNVSVAITPPPPSYGLPATPPVWQFTDTATDTASRVQTVTFERLNAPTLVNSGDEAKSFDAVKTVQVTAFGGATATYTFHYSPDASGADHVTLIARPLIAACACNDRQVNENVYAPLLTSITLPDGSSYSMTYYTSTGTDRSFSGSVRSLTLPTFGKYEWAYQTYTFPTTNPPPPPPGGIQNPPDTLRYSTGLLDEIKRDATGARLQQTHYDTLTNSTETTLRNTVKVFAPGDTQDVLLSRSVHYFGTVLGMSNYGLPMTADSPNIADPDAPGGENIANPDVGGGKTRYLSTKTYDGVGNLLNYSYLSYGAPAFLDAEKVVDSEKVFYRNPVNGSLTSSTTDSTDFDGYGHYRTVVTSGSGFPGSNNTRTVTTAYNKADPDAGGTIFDTGTAGTSSAQRVSSDSPWLINMYSSVTAAEGTSIRKSLFSFNTTTGFLERTRSLVASVPDASGRLAPGVHDVVTKLTPDAAGNVQLEEYFGGDLKTLSTSPLADASLTGRSYGLLHQYSSGALSKSSYIDPACASNPQTNCPSILDVIDRTIDAKTGLTATSRDTSGLATTFGYDTSGRLTSVVPPGTAQTTYSYANATSTAAASVTAETAISGTTDGLKSIYTYDSLGRLVLESTIANDKTRYRSTSYDAAGRKASVSSLETSAAPGHPTTFSYDALNRVISVTEPDGSVTSFDRNAEPATTKRTMSVYTSAGDTAATTIEQHDRQNRLSSLQEPNNTVTTYTYDVADHLTSVTMPGENNITQHRYFTYDGLGFLRSERHPELGASGDSFTFYAAYDARGHAHHKFTGAAFGGTYDVTFAYDLSERLTNVRDFAGDHLLKSFTFGDANGTNPADYRKGKLLTAARYNKMPHVSGDVSVTETYKYENSSGRASERDTEMKNGSTVLQSFKQLFTYDTLGAVTAPGYPTCLPTVTCSIPTLTTATNVYTNGLLTGVSAFATLAYNDNGTLGSVTHTNNVVDTIEQDVNRMPRPKSIAYGPWTTCAAPTAPSVTAASAVCSSSTGNAASIVFPAGGVTYTWSISPPDAQITSATTGTSITYSAGAGPTITLLVTASNGCGSATTNTYVAVGRPTATVSNGSSPSQIQAALTGVGPWTITWSDSVQQTVSSSPATRTVSPGTYSVTTIVNGSGCVGTSSGSATVLATPAFLSARTQDGDSRMVHVTWALVSGATSYRIERATCTAFACWSSVAVSNSATIAFYDDIPPLVSGQPVVTYLYRVVALAGNAASWASTLDYATTATTLFAETIVGGSTRIRGSHVKELRNAIDAVRNSAGLPPYAPASGEGWTGWPASYSPASGRILAVHVGAMRRALEEAVSQLNGSHLAAVANPSGKILAVHFNDLREAVR